MGRWSDGVAVVVDEDGGVVVWRWVSTTLHALSLFTFKKRLMLTCPHARTMTLILLDVKIDIKC